MNRRTFWYNREKKSIFEYLAVLFYLKQVFMKSIFALNINWQTVQCTLELKILLGKPFDPMAFFLSQISYPMHRAEIRIFREQLPQGLDKNQDNRRPHNIRMNSTRKCVSLPYMHRFLVARSPANFYDPWSCRYKGWILRFGFTFCHVRRQTRSQKYNCCYFSNNTSFFYGETWKIRAITMAR